MASWNVSQVKANFRELLDKTQTEGPQLIIRRNQKFYMMTKEQFMQGDASTSETPKDLDKS